jgi:Toxin SymE, type I toxin-antitoxin system
MVKFRARRLTVSTLRVPPWTPFHLAKNPDRKTRFVPFVRMSGDWLEEVGFPRGAKIKVTVSHRRLILERVA